MRKHTIKLVVTGHPSRMPITKIYKGVPGEENKDTLDRCKLRFWNEYINRDIEIRRFPDYASVRIYVKSQKHLNRLKIKASFI